MGDRIQRIVVAIGDRAWSADGVASSVRARAARVARQLGVALDAGAKLLVVHRGARSVPAGQEASIELRGSEVVEDDMLAVCLREELKSTRREVVAVATPILVDPTRSGSRHRRRPVGPVLDRRAAERLRGSGAMLWPETAREGEYRQLVPEVEPLELLDGQGLRQLVEGGAVVVSGGGGGVPVVREGRGWRCPAAVVDPDLTAALLADSIDADELLIVTDVSHVFEDYGTPHELPIGRIGADALHDLLAEGHFAGGTMAPKVEACVRFVSRTGRRAVICEGPSMGDALEDRAGTRVFWTEPGGRADAVEPRVASLS